MAYMLSLLSEMRGRLGMYVGETSITKLAAFLRGYDYAVTKLVPGEGERFLPEFRDWIHQRFQSAHQSWEETILQQSTDEVDAVKNFWALLDEFLKETHEGPASQKTTSETEVINGRGLPRTALGSPTSR
jgi:hypothetical protein